MRYQKCHWNQRLRCPLPLDCPLQDREWSDILDLWALTGREVATSNWLQFGSGCRIESNALKKAEIARLFEIPEAIENMIKFGGMTKSICEELQRGRYLWNETRAGISLKRAKGRWIERIRRKSDGRRCEGKEAARFK